MRCDDGSICVRTGDCGPQAMVRSMAMMQQIPPTLRSAIYRTKNCSIGANMTNPPRSPFCCCCAHLPRASYRAWPSQAQSTTARRLMTVLPFAARPSDANQQAYEGPRRHRYQRPSNGGADRAFPRPRTRCESCTSALGYTLSSSERRDRAQTKQSKHSCREV